MLPFDQRPVTRAWKRKELEKHTESKKQRKQIEEVTIKTINSMAEPDLFEKFKMWRTPEVRILYFDKIEIKKSRRKRAPLNLLLMSYSDENIAKNGKKCRKNKGKDIVTNGNNGKRKRKGETSKFIPGRRKKHSNKNITDPPLCQPPVDKRVDHKHEIQSDTKNSEIITPQDTKTYTNGHSNGFEHSKEESINLTVKKNRHSKENDELLNKNSQTTDFNTVDSKCLLPNPRQLLVLRQQIIDLEARLLVFRNSEESIRKNTVKINREETRLEYLKDEVKFEENKIKLRGLVMEQNRLNYYIEKTKRYNKMAVVSKNDSNYLLKKIHMTLNDRVAGNLDSFLESVVQQIRILKQANS
ncbi:uncharacterized protein LOC130646164 [Hydractinia symbiolongicarpus]|uniref:uncharacterized protein LOC130644169 n=1 Tax=Hydractinia symbiolongicarpus TaxID=13093 RepID=UPI002550053D|nr:uncharacterized protein LOC130644169 [Hydractinia symbiolongicarpus]XP_057305651.1 uncharacterized protein LOC130644169 [Hydractinia symbiolongicarpus]XP_057305652.1 uncharacterized protein LOC130644169 [Hydractinia symbiolongicarpus]XP_057308289.1 uncharacterized protein LOC130646164 [Hydractinia symbiolongicarpus]XP_057308290.1 uncharacterized protein LOC130646164 [Hydractinia symbiolongicarpus]XP_057308291.1 uncharacterized protein LOC130646164 [Hydractinia symbiolongicarpus]XP_05730829